jgi:hypothetical protein
VVGARLVRWLWFRRHAVQLINLLGGLRPPFMNFKEIDHAI